MFDISRSQSVMMDTSFAVSIALVLGGSLASGYFQQFASDMLVDMPFKGGDAVYELAFGAVALAILPARYSRPLALGAGASALGTVAADFGVVEMTAVAEA